MTQVHKSTNTLALYMKNNNNNYM